MAKIRSLRLIVAHPAAAQPPPRLRRNLARRAEFHDRSIFDLDAVLKSRAMLGDLDGLFFVFNMKEKIATDRFLGFDERAIDDRVPLFFDTIIGERFPIQVGVYS